MIDELYGCTCGCCGGEVKDAASVGFEIGDDLLNDILQEIYDEEVDKPSGISPTLFNANKEAFHKAIDNGFINSPNEEIDTDAEFVNAIKHSADVFSLHRTATQSKLLAERMIDADGNLKSFEQFVKDTRPINEHYNKAWLRTEYDTAVLRAQMAADWKVYERDADVFPNLRWMQTTSVTPRESHAEFWMSNLTLPIDDPFWNQHRPGDQWNCKCYLQQTSDPATTKKDMPDAANMPEPKEGLKGNPAKTKEIFSQDHPYYPDKCATCPLNTDGKVHGVKKGKAQNGPQIGTCVFCELPGITEKRLKLMYELKSIPDKELVKTLLDYQGEEFQARLLEILRKAQFKDHQKIKNLHIALGEDKEDNKDYKRLVNGASKLLRYADDVWIIRNFGDVKTADFVVRYGNMYKYMDQKTVNSFNSIEQEIKKHINQARRFLLNVAVSCDSKDFAGHVKKCFEQNDTLSEIIVAQGDKYISIQRKDVFNKNYYQIVRETWSKKKRKK